MKYVLFAFLAYILYLFIFRLVIPVYMTTRKIKKGFREMQAKMQEQQQGFNQQAKSPNPSPKTKAGDYIDFEEVK